MSAEERYMTVEDVAKYLGFEKQTVYNKVHANQIPYHKIGPKAVRFVKEEIDEWIRSQQERERSYQKKGDRYYVVWGRVPRSSLIATEDELLENVKTETASSWYLLSVKANLLFDRLEFEKEDLNNARSILKKRLIYPRVINQGVFAFEWSDSGTVTNYLTILKILKGMADVDFLIKLRKRLVENASNSLLVSSEDILSWRPEAELGFRIEQVADDMLSELRHILVYLAYKKDKSSDSKYLLYANRYFDAGSFLSLYFHGFCDFVKDPFSGEVDSFIVQDTAIDRLTPEQIQIGIKQKVFTREEALKAIKALEAHIKNVKAILAAHPKGDN